MTERREQDPDEQTPEQAAAQGTIRGEQDEEHPQEETDSTFFDTEQHSDAPGPFGTG